MTMKYSRRSTLRKTPLIYCCSIQRHRAAVNRFRPIISVRCGCCMATFDHTTGTATICGRAAPTFDVFRDAQNYRKFKAPNLRSHHFYRYQARKKPRESEAFYWSQNNSAYLNLSFRSSCRDNLMGGIAKQQSYLCLRRPNQPRQWRLSGS